jgi:tetratricopeptide (TPR) repeat protein
LVIDAIKDYDRAIKLDPNQAIAYINRGSLKYRLNLNKEAITDFEIALSLNPNIPSAALKNINALKDQIIDFEKRKN